MVVVVVVWWWLPLLFFLFLVFFFLEDQVVFVGGGFLRTWESEWDVGRQRGFKMGKLRLLGGGGWRRRIGRTGGAEARRRGGVGRAR